MENILIRGLDFIGGIQIIADPPLAFIVRVINFTGGAPVYVILLLVLFWCIDEKKGLHFGIVILISIWINLTLKFLLDQPRSFFNEYDPPAGMIGEHADGFPSGHAQNTLVMLAIIVSWVKKKWVYICAIGLCLLTGFSRIYLGLHFTAGVIGGWIIGAVIITAYFLSNKKIETLISKGGFRAGFISTAAASFIMIQYLPSAEMLIPGGIFLGLGTGYCINKRNIGFSSSNTSEKIETRKYQKLSGRMLLGMAGLYFIFLAAVKLIPEESANESLYKFIQAAILGFWISAAAPWIFIKLRLAEKQALSANRPSE